MSHRVALCTHLAVEHFRGGEKWVVEVANRLAADGITVEIYSLPYAPGGERRIDAADVLDDAVGYTEGWRHDVTGYDTAYSMYAPGMGLSVRDGPDTRSVAGIHSWAFITDRLFESHYGVVPTAAKLCYRIAGPRELRQYDAVHTVSPVFDSPHPETTHVPNFVDSSQYSPDRRELADEFTVLTTAAHIREKGWDVIQEVAERLPAGIRLVTTGECDHPDIEELGFLHEAELADIYSAAHLLLHPTRVDTDSMAINEAVASGTPVVTSSLPTHTRWDESVMHVDGTTEIADCITDLYDEFHVDFERYAARCNLARHHGLNRDVELVYRRFRRLLLPEWTAEDGRPASTDWDASVSDPDTSGGRRPVDGEARSDGGAPYR
jgi:glycosyltransferase involved in cell wall biosynthesis